jgi:hypothetical protein
VATGVGLLIGAGGIAVSVEWGSHLGQWVGFGIYFSAVWVIAGPVTLWLVARYGVLDSLKKWRKWTDTAPRADDVNRRD